ncbi:MAG: enoyl-CoA hydratase-related protein, partial [Desulfarculaceae bacterium]
EWGMVNEVVKADQVLPRALELAQELAQGPAEALASTKALLNRAVLADLETILEEERQEVVRLVDRPDFHEGIRAFMEKRQPEFKN